MIDELMGISLFKNILIAKYELRDCLTFGFQRLSCIQNIKIKLFYVLAKMLHEQH